MSNQWTPERRAAQSVRIRANKPWLKSTGPKTRTGKKKSSQNAVKHGDDRTMVRTARKALRLQREFMALLLPVLGESSLNPSLQAARTNYIKTQMKTDG